MFLACVGLLGPPPRKSPEATFRGVRRPGRSPSRSIASSSAMRGFDAVTGCKLTSSWSLVSPACLVYIAWQASSGVVAPETREVVTARFVVLIKVIRIQRGAGDTAARTVALATRRGRMTSRTASANRQRLGCVAISTEDQTDPACGDVGSGVSHWKRNFRIAFIRQLFAAVSYQDNTAVARAFP